MSESHDTSDLVRAAAVDFLVGSVDRSRLRGWIGRARPVDRSLWKECAGLGWTGMLLPESLGGMDSSLRDALVICEESGRHLFAEPLVAAAVMPSSLLTAAAAGPSQELTASLAGMLLEGERVLCVAWQEAAGRLDAGAPLCELREGRITGVKRFVVGCDPDSVALVWTVSEGEPALVAVDMRDEGVVRDPQPAGLAAHCELTFNGARALDERPLLKGDIAARALSGALAAGRLGMAAQLSGQAAGCLQMSLAHLRTRRQFDRALASFQAVQHRCVDLFLEVELANASWRDALERVEKSAGGILALAADAAICAAKARAGEAAVNVGRAAVQFHGAMGFCDDVDVGFYLRDALQGNAFLGGPVALRRRFSRQAAADSALTAHA